MTIAFFSYSHLDLKADTSLIDEMRDGLEAHSRAELASKNFHIWRDTEGIRWGVDWHNKLHEEIGRSELFFILLSPGWLNSDVCHWEYQAFLQREAKLGGAKRILVAQIRNIDVSTLDLKMRNAHSELVTRQYKNFRHWLDATPHDRAKVLRAAGEDVAALLRAAATPASAPQGAAVPATFATPAPTRGVPLDATEFALVSGDYYVPRQNADAQRRPVLLNLIVAGDAYVRTQHGTVVFTLRQVEVYTHISGGRIAPPDDGRAPPPLGPGVREVSGGANTRCHVIVEDGGMGLRGTPLSPDGRRGHVEILEVEVAEGATLLVSGHAKVKAEAIHVDFERSPDKARLSQVKKLSELILKRCGGERFPLEGVE